MEAGEHKVDGGVSWSRQVGVEIDGSSETERRTEGEVLQSETSGDISSMTLLWYRCTMANVYISADVCFLR